MKKHQNIDNYLELTKYFSQSSNTIAAVQLLNKYQKRALDLGCGSLRNSKFLFNCGFIVDAIDNNPKVKNYCQFFDYQPKKFFNLIVADFLKLKFEKDKYNLVIAQNSLPFNTEGEVKKMIDKIYVTLKTGGIFAGNLWGSRDYHTQNKTISSYTKNDIKSLMNNFKIKELSEYESDDKIGEKNYHFHTFEFVVEKK